MAKGNKTTPDVTTEIQRLLTKAGLTESDVSETIASIQTIQEVSPIRDGAHYREYEERYRKMMQDAGFIGKQRSWEEYMDYIRTPHGRLALTLFNRMAEWKLAKGVP
jgi:ABC-type nitrate/sulfonate/bicarbonate transport system substrate-binding protein